MAAFLWGVFSPVVSLWSFVGTLPTLIYIGVGLLCVVVGLGVLLVLLNVLKFLFGK